MKATPVSSTAIKIKSSLPPRADKLSHPSTGRRYWARQLIDRAPKPLVEYGSIEWLTLPTDDPAKVASCVAAAECWAYSADNMEADLRREIEASQVAFKTGEDAAYQEQARAHRAKYRNGSTLKGFMERRAAQLAASQPKPDAYTGGPVTWDRGPA